MAAQKKAEIKEDRTTTAEGMGYASTTPEQGEIRAAFGRKIDVNALAGFGNIEELLAVHRDTLKVENGNPQYEYGWMDLRDPACQVKLRKGLWELVTSENDPDLVCPGALDPRTTSEKGYRVNELALVRMPKDRYEKLRAAETALAARKELAAQESFYGNVERIESQMGLPGAAAASFQERSDARIVKEAVTKR